MGQPGFGPLNLPIPSFTTQLGDDFMDLCDAGGAHRMSPAEQPAGSVDRNLTAYRGLPLGCKLCPLSGGAQSHRFVMQNLTDAEGIVTFRNIKVLRADPGFFISGFTTPIIGFPSNLILWVFIVSRNQNSRIYTDDPAALLTLKAQNP